MKRPHLSTSIYEEALGFSLLVVAVSCVNAVAHLVIALLHYWCFGQPVNFY